MSKDNNAEYYRAVVGAAVPDTYGMVQAWILSGNTGYIVRCDTPENVTNNHTVGGKEYRNWQQEFSGRAGVYYTPALFYGARRSASTLNSMREVYVDMDDHQHEKPLKGALEAVCEAVRWRAAHDGLPQPWIVATGRGLHLHWAIVPEYKTRADFWRQVMEALNDWADAVLDEVPEAEAMSTDPSIVDTSRVLRLPDTLHANGSVVDVVRGGDAAITLDAFARKLADGGYHVGGDGSELHSGIYLRTPLAANVVAVSRAARLHEWIDGRGNKLNGNRHNVLFCLACVIKCTGADILTELRATNARFTDPLPDDEVVAIPAKAAKYKLRTRWIAQKLGMTPAERLAFGAVYGQPVRVSPYAAKRMVDVTGIDYRRQNRARDEARAKNKQERAAKYARIPELKAKGFTQAEAAAELGVSLRTVKSRWHMDFHAVPDMDFCAV